MRVIPVHDLYEFLAKVKADLGKHPKSRAALGASALVDEIIVHFGLTPGAQLTVIRDEHA